MKLVNTKRVPLSCVSLSQSERRYVDEAVATGWISSAGPYVARFADAVARKVGRKHCIPTASGTCALDLALRALGVTSGD